MFATLKLVSVLAIFGSIAGVIGIPISFVLGNVRRLYKISMWIIRTGLGFAGIRVEVTGAEHVPAGVSCIFMCNHVSNLDPPVVLPAIPGQSSVLLKQELMKIPILGTAMRMAKFVPVERGARRDAAAASVTAAGEALRSGLHILVFPEGTRSVDGRLSKFKKGPFFLAQQTGAPVIPVAVSGTEKMMRKGSQAITPGVAKVQMLGAIYPGDYGTREEMMAAAWGAIDNVLPGEMKGVGQ